jgi:hypothetical protein
LDCWAEAIAQATAGLEGRLTRAQWNYLFAALLNCYVQPELREANLAVALQLEDYHRHNPCAPFWASSPTPDKGPSDPYAEEWVHALAGEVRRMSYVEVRAILVAVRWAGPRVCDRVIDKERDEWWTLRFRAEAEGVRGGR